MYTAAENEAIQKYKQEKDNKNSNSKKSNNFTYDDESFSSSEE